MTYLLVSCRKSMPCGWINAKYTRPADRSTEGPSELHSMPASLLVRVPFGKKLRTKSTQPSFYLYCLKCCSMKQHRSHTAENPLFISGLELSPEMQNSPPKRKSRHDSLIVVFMLEAYFWTFGTIPCCRYSCIIVGREHRRNLFYSLVPQC